MKKQMTQQRLLTLCVCTVVVVLISLSHWGNVLWRFRIINPVLGVPHIGTTTTPLVIKLRTALPFSSSNWEILLTHSDSQHQYTFSHRTSRWSQKGQQTITLALPDTVSPGRYHLMIDNGPYQQISPYAIHVRASMPKKLTIVQLADLPIFSKTDDSIARMADLVKEINLINPDLVLLTGDLAKGGLAYQYDQLSNALAAIHAPGVVAPGNHAHDNWYEYLTRFGEENHSVDLGYHYLISLHTKHGRNQFTKNQLHWLKQRIKEAGDKPIIIQLHHPLFAFVTPKKVYQRNVRARTGDFFDIIKDANIPIILSGHMQGDSVFDIHGNRKHASPDFAGPKLVTTTAAGDRVREKFSDCAPHWGYRLIRFSAGELQNYTYDYDGDGQRDTACSIPVGHLHSETLPGVGTITNNLNESFERATIAIPVENRQRYSKWRADVGTIVDWRKAGQQDLAIVELAVAARSQTTVTISGVP